MFRTQKRSVPTPVEKPEKYPDPEPSLYSRQPNNVYNNQEVILFCLTYFIVSYQETQEVLISRPNLHKPKSLKVLSAYEVCKQECRRERDQDSEREVS